MTVLSVHSSAKPTNRSKLRSVSTLGAAAGLSALAVALLAGCGSDDEEPTNDGGRAGQTANGGRSGGGAGGRSAAGSGGTAGSSTGGSSGDAAAGASTDGGAMGGETIDPADYEGEEVFRHDTFGSEQYWTDTLRLNEAIQAALTPTMALELGLKVDADALPEGTLETADLEDPATTVALIKLGAVVGIKGEVDAANNLMRIGVTCALCHSDVDDSVMDGIGSRMDGHANRDLDSGAIIALSPGLADDEEALAALSAWGPGFYDARWNQDGISDPVAIPPIYGLQDVPLATYTGDGPISYWNQYVAVTQMGGQGVFYDSRIDVAVLQTPDLVTPKLPALFDYQMGLEVPEIDVSDLNAASVTRGRTLFNGVAQCSTCHSGPALTDAANTLHAPEETGMEPLHAERSATGMYRTTPLRALAQHAPYFHDGSAETLADVVTHYNTVLSLGLTTTQRADLAVYLQSL